MKTMTMDFKHHTGKVFGAILLACLTLTSTYHYLLFHSLAEIFTIIIAGCMFVLVWNTRQHMDDDYLLFLGIAYFFAGMLDLVHTLGYEGMGIFPQYGPDLAPQLWIASRYLQGLSLLAAPLVIGRRINTNWVIAGYMLIVGLALATILYWRIFPVCFIPGAGLTPFKVFSEYIISAILIGAMLFTLRRRQSFHPDILRLLLWSITLTIGVELSFTFYVKMYGLSNLIGHLLRIISFYLLYKAIVETGLKRPYDLMFHDLTKSEAALTEANITLEQRVKERTIELTRSEEQLQLLLNSVGEGIYGVDMEGKVTFVNPEAARLLGYERDELLGRQQHAVIHHTRPDGSPYPLEECPIYAAFTENIAQSVSDEVFWGKDSKSFPVSYTSTPVPGRDGRPTGAVIVFRDITEHKKAELDRASCQVAEEANRAKSVFVANMSHEIRTPMNAILGFAQVLERDPSLTPKQVEHVRIITRSGGHLLHLINDILDMSKIDAGRTIINESSFCLHDLLNDLELMFRSRADAKGLQLLVERDESVPRCATADEGKLRQVLVNLMGNAVKFTEKGGVAMRVRAEAVAGKPVVDTKTLRLVVEVEDSGPGIAAEDAGMIFDAFQQAETGIQAGGTGLGLAISRKFAEMMGGSLTVASRVGKGSCFRFEALLAPAVEISELVKPALRRVVGLEPGPGPYRILVVDDIADNRTLVIELLRPVGFEVAEAVNGVEALEVFERWSPHAVLMDMRMPVMDGYEATRRLKAMSATPVIAITASAFEDARANVIAAGVDVYLRKPFRPEELFEALEKTLDLRYLFAEDTPAGPDRLETAPLTAQSLAAVPKDVIQSMRQSVAEGDMARLAELIAKVETIDGAAAHALQALADQYEYEKLDQWLGKKGIGDE